MYCRHENDGVQKAEVKFINVGIFANLSYSLFYTDHT